MERVLHSSGKTVYPGDFKKGGTCRKGDKGEASFPYGESTIGLQETKAGKVNRKYFSAGEDQTPVLNAAFADPTRGTLGPEYHSTEVEQVRRLDKSVPVDMSNQNIELLREQNETLVHINNELHCGKAFSVDRTHSGPTLKGMESTSLFGERCERHAEEQIDGGEDTGMSAWRALQLALRRTKAAAKQRLFNIPSEEWKEVALVDKGFTASPRRRYTHEGIFVVPLALANGWETSERCFPRVAQAPITPEPEAPRMPSKELSERVA